MSIFNQYKPIVIKSSQNHNCHTRSHAKSNFFASTTSNYDSSNKPNTGTTSNTSNNINDTSIELIPYDMINNIISPDEEILFRLAHQDFRYNSVNPVVSDHLDSSPNQLCIESSKNTSSLKYLDPSDQDEKERQAIYETSPDVYISYDTPSPLKSDILEANLETSPTLKSTKDALHDVSSLESRRMTSINLPVQNKNEHFEKPVDHGYDQMVDHLNSGSSKKPSPRTINKISKQYMNIVANFRFSQGFNITGLNTNHIACIFIIMQHLLLEVL